MYRSILVPLDGSPFAEHALPLALALARRSRSAIHLVLASTPLSGACLEGGASISLPELEELVATRYRSYLEATRARLRQRIDVPITGEVLLGGVSATLCTLAASGRHDLVVMATHGRSPLGRLWLGSVADDLIHHVNLPLLLIRQESEEPNLEDEPDLSRVVVPLDGSPLAEGILEPAIALAKVFLGPEVLLVRVIPATAADEAADVAHSRTWSAARQYLDDVAARLEARGVRVQTHVLFDDRPAEAILHEAADEHVGVIALETHGRAGLARLLHGSVTDRVVRGATIPVLVHHPAHG
jgi:nucleotide-binding universal stress UspA family protein